MVIYLLLVNVAVSLGYMIYYFTLRKLTFFQWNRLYLLGTVIFALLIPIGLFIDISSYFDDQVNIPIVNMEEIIDVAVVVGTTQRTSLVLVDLLIWIYAIGLLISLGLLGWKLWQVREMFRSNSNYLGFSFFNKIFLGKEIKQYASIERHEQIHIEQGHSYDVVFMELFKAFNWFNPIVYRLVKEIKFLHECIADELSSEDKVAYAKLLVAHAMKVPQNVLVHEFSNQSFLKKRIMMLFQNKSSKNKRYLYLGIVPAVLIVGLSTVVFNTSRAKGVVANVESKIEDLKLAVDNENTSQANINLNAEHSSNAIAQDTIKEGGDEIFKETEILPEFPGGMSVFRKWIGDNYQYPQAAIDAGAQGTIRVRFVIEKDGSLSDIKAVQDIGHGTGEAAVNVLKKAPKWSPAIQNGRKVRFAFEMPIRINLVGRDRGSDDTQDIAKDTIRGKSGGQLIIDDKEKKETFSQAEIQPEPPGGLVAYRKWVADSYKYPKAAIDAEVKGTITVTFVVEKDGTLSDIKAARDLGHGTGEAAVEVLKTSKKWSPGIQNGKPVRVAYALPIRLDLTKR